MTPAERFWSVVVKRFSIRTVDRTRRLPVFLDGEQPMNRVAIVYTNRSVLVPFSFDSYVESKQFLVRRCSEGANGTHAPLKHVKFGRLCPAFSRGRSAVHSPA